ncbi:hypothetical protein AOT83_24955 [Mycobacteroides sp. H001]|uniref:hypothetical protein n=1 Tax=Mycobacteroides TaxID=670516 RepID=UPI0007131A6C|nr:MULTISPECIES: hypothetical protein [Mycobacteroides]KRQ23407.1 hypothetical protein AOT86_17825 [Mycobacteroides sp. H072]KRQ40536.1 hypothetical protein AOT84_04255 [Mycobacteroides sp. H002]KRQ45839.1 hypothetical protein AOT85_24635 [Mycobacteroides sp. H054]KRQ65810.1 hypothetical protein AOT83_24955 [Mycobacteroides sp. H001]OHU40260.1 hypothetical protein BKG79_09770 [Mycobacteroides chelonae]
MSRTPVTFYALLAGGREPDDPAGIVRRIHTDPPLDEAFGRDLEWHPTEYIRRYYLGHNDVDHVEIDEGSAKSILDRWRIEWAEQDGAGGTR